jgi:hypothetical protein
VDRYLPDCQTRRKTGGKSGGWRQIAGSRSSLAADTKWIGLAHSPRIIGNREAARWQMPTRADNTGFFAKTRKG